MFRLAVALTILLILAFYLHLAVGPSSPHVVTSTTTTPPSPRPLEVAAADGR